MMSKFKPVTHYDHLDGYQLLPFSFTQLAGHEYVITNMTGEFLVLDRQHIVDLVHHRLPTDTEIYRSLKSKHFLMAQDSNVAIDLLALKTRTKYSRLADFTALHIFVVTLRCEHSCPYCQVSRRNDAGHAFDMSTETATRALDLMFRSPSPVLKIEFQGGETMLNFSLIQHIVERAEVLNTTEQRSIEFVLATNLAVVTDDILAYCAEHRILISTSLDGPADLHNANRPRPGGDSHQRVISGIQRSREALGHDRVGALMTTTQASLSRVRDIVDEYVRLGFHSIFLRPMSPYGFAIKTQSYKAYDTDRWTNFYFEGLDYILQLNKGGLFLVETYASIILAKMLTPFGTGYVDLRSPAGIGIGALVYNYDGDVYASDESRMLAEMNDKTFRLGNVHTDTWRDILTSDALLAPLEDSFALSAPMCSECAFEPFCGAEPVFHHATQGDAIGHKPSSSFCRRNMAIFRRLIMLMREDPEARPIFLRWVNECR
jgi:uncharacterized protein